MFAAARVTGPATIRIGPPKIPQSSNLNRDRPAYATADNRVITPSCLVGPSDRTDPNFRGGDYADLRQRFKPDSRVFQHDHTTISDSRPTTRLLLLTRRLRSRNVYHHFRLREVRMTDSRPVRCNSSLASTEKFPRPAGFTSGPASTTAEFTFRFTAGWDPAQESLGRPRPRCCHRFPAPIVLSTKSGCETKDAISRPGCDPTWKTGSRVEDRIPRPIGSRVQDRVPGGNLRSLRGTAGASMTNGRSVLAIESCLHPTRDGMPQFGSIEARLLCPCWVPSMTGGSHAEVSVARRSFGIVSAAC